ncbi:restriction endonuclease subunit S [Proteus mirabilis]|uniref:restriction endonuclease subunit S n=1 Tax=Proteus mirabilis TaxID=584 RepID=UPI003ED98AF4
MVPNGWKLSTIEEISSVSSGGTPSRKNESYWNGNIPWVTTAEVQFKIIEDTAEKITEEGLANSSAKLFPVDTILIAMYGQGKTRGQVAKLGIEASTNQACAAIILKAGYHVDYYYQFLISQYDNIREMANSGGQENLSGGIVKSIKVPVPPLPEQKKIAKILSTWDKAIATTEKLIDASQQQKKALMQQLLTGKKRLVDPDTGKVFEGKWEEVKLDDLALYRRGSFPQPYGNPEWVDEVNGYPFIQVFDIDKNMKLKKATKTKISDAAIDKSVFIEAGTVIVSLQGSIGRVAITQYDAYVDRTVLLFQSFKRKMDTIYFAYAIQELFEIEKEKAPGGTIKTITKQVLSNFTIKVPTHYEQQKIASVLTAADKEIELLQAKLAHLKDEKKALMQQLLTGKRRVKVEAMEMA